MIKRKILLSALLIGFAIAAIQWQRADYLSVRIEGLSKWDSFLSGISYLRKYKRKKTTTSDSIRKYFTEQSTAYKAYQSCLSDSSIISLAFVGDLMWIRSNWNDFLSPEVKSSLEQHDVVFGNLETPIDTISSIPHFWPDYLTYNSGPGLIRSFFSEKKQKNIFSALSLANNHCFDRKSGGLLHTMQFLDKEHIKHSGARLKTQNTEPYTLIEEKGIRIGYYAICWGVNDVDEMKNSGIQINVIPGLAPLDPTKISIVEVKKVLDKMDKDHIDFKVLNIHWGYEFEQYPDPEIIKLAHKLVAAGADLIIGSHSHMIQPDEICFVNNYADPVMSDKYASEFLLNHELTDEYGIPRKALIVYSLGNFTTNMFTSQCKKGAIQSIKLVKNRLTGRMDWQSPDIQYVYNSDADPVSGKKKLIMWKKTTKFEKQ